MSHTPNASTVCMGGCSWWQGGCSRAEAPTTCGDQLCTSIHLRSQLLACAHAFHAMPLSTGRWMHAPTGISHCTLKDSLSVENITSKISHFRYPIPYPTLKKTQKVGYPTDIPGYHKHCPHHTAHNLRQAHTMEECTRDSPQSCNSCIFLHLSEQRASQAAGNAASSLSSRQVAMCSPTQ